MDLNYTAEESAFRNEVRWGDVPHHLARFMALPQAATA
jgi:hypothetical protein